MFPADRSLDHLKPEMQARVKAWLALLEKEGIKVLITETRRSKARQLFLYAKGRYLPQKLELEYLGYDDPAISSKPGEAQVTWTLQSKHIDGLAIDFGFMVNGQFSYNGDWNKCYDLAEKCGLSSLYRAKGVDRPHLEFNSNWKPLDDKKLQLIRDNEKILAQRMEVAQKALGEVNAARKYLCELKGIPVKLYKITE